MVYLWLCTSVYSSVDQMQPFLGSDLNNSAVYTQTQFLNNQRNVNMDWLLGTNELLILLAVVMVWLHKYTHTLDLLLESRWHIWRWQDKVSAIGFKILSKKQGWGDETRLIMSLKLLMLNDRCMGVHYSSLHLCLLKFFHSKKLTSGY